MRALNSKTRTVVCRTCGTDISENTRYNHWTQCSVCYWKGRFERQEPLENLLKRRSEMRARLDVLPSEIEKQKQAFDAYTDALRRNAPWWRRFLNNWRDQTVEAYSRRLYDLNAESRKLEKEYSRLQMAVENAKHTKKRFSEAQLAQNAAAARRQVKAEQHENFCAASTSNLTREFDRTKFYIRPYDYRRGNVIDNYFRRNEDTVLTAFGHSCVFCNTSHDLTFDHYGLPKNEGGNFVLISTDRASIRLNIVVLCRGCNAAKGQSGYQLFFNDAQRERAMACQRVLLETLLADEAFLKLIKKWHR